MGMSTNVEGFRPPDERWKAMAAVHKACRKACIDIPGDVCDFFEGEEPNENQGVAVNIDNCVSEADGETSNGWIVDIQTIQDMHPFDKFLKFTHSY